MSKLTLKEKKLLNEEVTNETKRCLSIMDEMYKALESYPDLEKENNTIYAKAKKEIIEGSPYIEFNKDLLKEIIK